MDKTKRITAANMPQKGKMKKTSMPQKGKMKKLHKQQTAAKMPQSGEMKDKGKRAHGNRPHRTLRLQLRWGMPVPRME